MTITLATTYHDAHDRMYDQIINALPTLMRLFDGIAVQVSPEAMIAYAGPDTHLGAHAKV
jgi:hypothetical protein